MHLKLNTKGFTLVELAVSLGLLGLISLFTMNMLQDQAYNETISKYRFEVDTTLALLQNTVNHPGRCDEMLKDKNVSVTGAEIPDDGLTVLTTDGTPKTLLAKGEYPGFSVASIQLRQSGLSVNSFDLVIEFRPPPRPTLISYLASPRSTQIKHISIVGKVDTDTQKVVSCRSVIAESNDLAKQIFCENLSVKAPGLTTWDDTTKKCSLNLTAQFKCTDNWFPGRLLRLGRVQCQDIRWGLHFSQLFDFSIKPCPSKIYAIYRLPNGKITVGCPAPGDKTISADLLI